MANGKRLIDVDVAEKSIRTSASLIRANIGCGYGEGAADALNSVADMLKAMPTVDAVEVVRCKDCKWAEYGKDYEPYCNHWKSGLYANIKDDDFCSYGERRTDNA